MTSPTSPPNAVVPEVRGFHSPDVDWRADTVANGEDFQILLQIFIGPKTNRGADTFDLLVATPNRILGSELGFIFGKATLVVDRFDKAAIEAAIREFVSTCAADSWEHVAKKISRIAHWEFDGYQPYQEPRPY